jgi:hypothetical protein
MNGLGSPERVRGIGIGLELDLELNLDRLRSFLMYPMGLGRICS